jgi:mannonate dehydratase
MAHAEVTDEVFSHSYRFEDGCLVMGEVPGLAVDIGEKRAAQHPYERAYLPVAQLRDGSMWNW